MWASRRARNSLPWFSAPYPNGKVICEGTEAGTTYGPVIAVYQVPATGFKPGFTCCCVPNPFSIGDPEHCQIDWNDEGFGTVTRP